MEAGKQEPKPQPPEKTTERRVNLGEKFVLFDPDKSRTVPESRIWRFKIPFVTPQAFISQISLNTGGLLPDLPFRIEANQQVVRIGISREGPGVLNINNIRFIHPGECLTPFKPDIGYQLTEKDWSLEERLAKLVSVKASPHTGTMSKEAQLMIAIHGDGVGKTLVKFGLAELATKEAARGIGVGTIGTNKPGQEVSQFFELGAGRFRINEASLRILRNLRLQLFFPNYEDLEAEPVEQHGFGEDAIVNFENFYPVDRGPLPTTAGLVVTDDILKLDQLLPQSREKGLKVRLANDPNKIRQVQAKFVLAQQDVPEVFTKAFEGEG